MKKVFQVILLLLLVSSAAAQEARPPVSATQPPTKILRVYDWNDLAQKHQLPGGEVVQMDGMSVLKIENTNNVTTNYSRPYYTISKTGRVTNYYDQSYVIDKPLKIWLLNTTNSVVKRTHWVAYEMKYENVQNGDFAQTNRPALSPSNNRWQEGLLRFWAYHMPSAPGGDERGHYSEFGFQGTSNWELHQFAVDQSESEGTPTRLILQLTLPGHGTVYIRPIKILGVTDSWWPAKQGGMIGGTVGIFGGLVGCFGGLLGCLAGFGKARKFVLMTTKIFIALGMLLTITGIVAIACGQPFFVWYVFLLPGVMLTLIFSLNFPLIQRRYDDLEIRRMASIDAMGS